MAAPAGSPDELPIDVDLIKVLASDSRRDILRHLGERRRTLTELAEALGLKKATVLEHLQKLVTADLIKKLDGDERLWIYYELSPRGKRLVRPERTRFYLILGATAAAALLLGAILAAAMLSNPGSFLPSPTRDPSDSTPLPPQATLEDSRSAQAPQVVWRGLDAEVAIDAGSNATDATLLLRSSDGSVTSFPVAQGRAVLSAERIDGLAPGHYAMSLASRGDESLLFDTLTVRDPSIALFPLSATAHTRTSFELALAPPTSSAPSNVSLVADGVPMDLTGAPFRLTLETRDEDLPLRIGRLATAQVAILPDFTLTTFERQGDALFLRVGSNGSSLPGATLLLDGVPLGTTNESGDLTTPWPALGEHALRILDAAGHAQDRPILVEETSARELPARLRMDAFDARVPTSTGLRIRADVFNDGAAPELVTVAVRQQGALVATALVNVPAHGRAEALLESPPGLPDVVDLTAHAARSLAPAMVQLRPQGTTAPESSGGAAAPAAPGRAFPYEAEDAYRMYADADARATLTFVAMPTSMAAGERAEAAARTPALSPVLVIALVALAAWATMPSRRGPKR